MQQYHNLQQDLCFFCIQRNLQSCITRSLFHKHNRGSDKLSQIVTQLVYQNNQKTLPTIKSSSLRCRYEQIIHLIDRKENIKKFMLFFSARLQLMDLLQYYKYRKYVPIFSGNIDNSCIAQSIHLYYYDRLKLYYNQIKKQFNMTIQSTFQQQLQSSSFNSKSDSSSKSITDNKSKILREITYKNSIQMIKNIQSQSKALNNLMKYLRKQQSYIKKLKKQRIQNEKQQQTNTKNNLQKKNNLAKYLMHENKLMIKKNNNNNKDYYRFIQISNNNKIINTINRYQIKKKSILQQFTKTIYSQKDKNRRKSQSLSKLKKQLSNNKFNTIDKQKSIINQKKKINIIHKSQNCLLNSPNTPLKKFYISKKQHKKQNVQIPLTTRQNRSNSSTSKFTNITTINTINSSNKCKLNLKFIINKKQIQCLKQYQTSKPLDQQKKKISHTKTPIKNIIQIDPYDNLPTINRKKLQQLKLKSQRKKQTKK